MNRHLIVAVGAALAVLAAAGCQPIQPGPGSGVHGLARVHVRHVHDPGQVTGTLTGPCRYRHRSGQLLPDRHCTPGAIDPRVTARRLCSASYTTESYRPPSSQTSAFKYGQAEPAYGEHDVPGELDHLVSLELGGANAAANLWPENGPVPNPKDATENRLAAWVCQASGQAAQRRLRAAQAAIASNWVTARRVLGTG